MQLQRRDWMRLECIPQIRTSLLTSLSHYLMVPWECVYIRNRFVRRYFNWNNWSSYPTSLWTSTPIVLLRYSKTASTNLFQSFYSSLNTSTSEFYFSMFENLWSVQKNKLYSYILPSLSWRNRSQNSHGAREERTMKQT